MMAKPKSKSVKKKENNSKVKVSEVLNPWSPELVMDGTAVRVFSEDDNVKYAEEQITEARNAFKLEKLRAEKEKGLSEFLKEGQTQILKLWQCIISLETHNTMYVVLFLISARF